jgi:hypothetical protein
MHAPHTKIYLLDIALCLLAVWVVTCISFGRLESAALAIVAASPGIFILVVGAKQWKRWRWWAVDEGMK